MSAVRLAFYAIVQDAEGNEETELVTLSGVSAEPGELPVIELTDGTVVTCIRPASEREAA